MAGELEQLAYKFERKTLLWEIYHYERIAKVSGPRYGSNLQQVGASVKKHEIISADILARQERFRDLKAMSSRLQQERYWREQEIRDREKAIMERWDQLLQLLGVHKDKFKRYCTIITLQREIETLFVTIMAVQHKLDTSESGSHLLDVQEKLQKF